MAAVIVALAVVFVGLAGWLVVDRATSGLPSEVEGVIDDYLRAYVAHDEATIRAVTTDDFRLTIHDYYEQLGLEGDLVRYLTSETLTHVIHTTDDWEPVQLGRSIVEGSDPWFVAVEETWNLCQNRDLATGSCEYAIPEEGVAVYVVVEEDGSLRIAEHIFAGLIDYEAVKYETD